MNCAQSDQYMMSSTVLAHALQAGRQGLKALTATSVMQSMQNYTALDEKGRPPGNLFPPVRLKRRKVAGAFRTLLLFSFFI